MGTAKKSTKAAKEDSKPDLPWVSITQAAIKASDLATLHAADLGNRVKPAFLQSFQADITALGAAVPAATSAHAGAVQLTAAQAAALQVGHSLVKGIRTAVKGQSPSEDVLLAYKVGTNVNKNLVKDVKGALEDISARITAQPAEADGFGITSDDLTAINNAVAAITAADAAQEAARAKAPKTTKDRNATARRLLAGIRLIAGAGMRVFATDPTVFANFEALTRKST